jgi:hypothetical protein
LQPRPPLWGGKELPDTRAVGNEVHDDGGAEGKGAPVVHAAPGEQRDPEAVQKPPWEGEDEATQGRHQEGQSDERNQDVA